MGSASTETNACDLLRTSSALPLGWLLARGGISDAARGTQNDGTVKKAGVGIYDITFKTGPTGSKVPLSLDECAIVATPRVEHESTPDEVSADVDVQRLGGPRIFVESTRPLPLGENKITPFLTNVSFDVAAIC